MLGDGSHETRREARTHGFGEETVRANFPKWPQLRTDDPWGLLAWGGEDNGSHNPLSPKVQKYEGHEAVLTTLSAQVMAVGKNKRLSKGKKGKGKKT